MPIRVSTVRGREFGDGVRAVVEGSGLTSRQVAMLVGCDEGKISEVLNGKLQLSALELAVLLSVCRPKAAERDRLLELHPAQDWLGWWQQHGQHSPAWPATAAAQVRVAKELIDWQPHVLPVFLRTDEYARELMVASGAVAQEEEKQEERVLAPGRLRNLLRDRLACTFYIHEFALRLQVGGPAVQKEQLLYLTLLENWTYVTIRVVPASAGAHAGVTGAFTLLKFPKYAPVVWLEALNSSTFLEQKDSVKGYETAVKQLDKVSMGQQESLKFINDLQNW
ncbi:helix-turn-helix domain-containing protein [Lentzea sp. CA-135723]|uniref:helix-turn-helix domain-containing protein n=1 Tax=Lentzea sp. CA-135723 TaxID=3239950 RepID=UPI003D8DE6E9